MLKIVQYMPLHEALRSIEKSFERKYDCESRRVQLFRQMANEAIQNPAFTSAVEFVIYDSFSSVPDLDEVRDLILEMPQKLRDVLEQYDVLEMVKKFSKHP